MGSRFYFVFVVLFFTGILISTVALRSANNRLFYRLCARRAEQSYLNQQLGGKQLQLEGMINPASVSERLGESKPDKQDKGS